MSQYDKILFAGDPHGNFEAVISAVRRHKPEAIVMLGDYDLDKPLETYLAEILDMTEILWIAGNHDFETPNKYQNLFHSALAHQCLHLKVTEVAGLRIAGLGGIFLGRVWYPPQPPKWQNKQHYLNQQCAHIKNAEISLKYRSAIWHDEFEALKKIKADILVTHEAPGSHRHGFSVIGELAAIMGAKQIFHGHLHENYTRTIKQQIKVCGVANRAVANLRGHVLSEVAPCKQLST